MVCHEKLALFLENNSPCPMGNFECSTCGGDKRYLLRLSSSIQISDLKLVLEDIGEFNQEQIDKICASENGLSSSPLALMLTLFSNDALKTFFSAWVSTEIQISAMLILISEGHKKRWDYSKDALLKLLKEYKNEILKSESLISKIRRLNEDWDLEIDVNEELSSF